MFSLHFSIKRSQGDKCFVLVDPFQSKFSSSGHFILYCYAGYQNSKIGVVTGVVCHCIYLPG